MQSFVEIAGELLEKQTVCRSHKNRREIIDDISKNNNGIQVISFVNAHAISLSQKNKSFFRSLLTSDLLFRDGVGMKILMRQLSMEPGLNMNGTDFIQEILQMTPRNARIALFGTTQSILELSEKKIRGLGFEDIILADGFRPDDEYLSLLKDNPPSVIILGMGMPKQERVSMKISQAAFMKGRNVQIINGGAILDFLSGKVPRAPRQFRKLGIEWLFRLWLEPVRLFPRFKDSVFFVLKVFVLKSKLKKYLRKLRDCKVNKLVTFQLK